VKTKFRSQGGTAEDIDWRSVREKIEYTIEATREAAKYTPDRTREILDERARRLAQPLADTRKHEDILDVLTFVLAGERYGIETRHVREVLRLTEFTAVPGAPDFIIGVTNLRGEIVVVVDLRLFFELPSKGLTDRSRIIIFGDAAIEFAIVADTVQSVVQLPVVDFLTEPVFEGKHGRNCVQGVTRDALIVLDGSALMSDQRLFL